MKINSPKIYPIKNPVAGNYPTGLFKYPFKAGSTAREYFTQTLVWQPAVEKFFDIETQYTAELTLIPIDKRYTFSGTTLDEIQGLPEYGIEDVTIINKDRDLFIRIVFTATGSEYAPPELIFYDDFSGDSLDNTKWETCPEWDRQGRSSWRDDMVSVSGGYLHLKFLRDNELGKEKSKSTLLANNWMRSGAVRTLKKNYTPIFENSFGYYEARIKFPVVRGTWGAFWLMSRTQQSNANGSVYGAEIDIVESINNEQGKYNGAVHWNGYGSDHKGISSDGSRKPDINIYDGEFHVFGFDWSPSEYIFYVDGEEFWRVKSEINQNPNYIKLSVEGAEWAGLLPADFTEDEMLVDYVKVYSGQR